MAAAFGHGIGENSQCFPGLILHITFLNVCLSDYEIKEGVIKPHVKLLCQLSPLVVNETLKSPHPSGMVPTCHKVWKCFGAGTSFRLEEAKQLAIVSMDYTIYT